MKLEEKRKEMDRINSIRTMQGRNMNSQISSLTAMTDFNKG